MLLRPTLPLGSGRQKTRPERKRAPWTTCLLFVICAAWRPRGCHQRLSVQLLDATVEVVPEAHTLLPTGSTALVAATTTRPTTRPTLATALVLSKDRPPSKRRGTAPSLRAGVCNSALPPPFR